MAHSALAIANALIDICRSKGISDLSPMKLQKLIYYAHGWQLGATGDSLIDEQVEAWQYGPVVQSVFDAAKAYGNRAIDSHLVSFEVQMFFDSSEPEVLSPGELSSVSPLLNWVVDQYGHHSAITLSNLTHVLHGPWHQVYQQYNGAIPRNTDIPPETIQRYFRGELEALTGGSDVR